MKIQSTTSHPVSPNAVGARAEHAVAQAYGNGAQAGSGSAQVALSPASRQLLALQEGGSDIDVERVAAIRAAIASGQLRIDPARIADSLIASARELLK
ncbi:MULTISPECIES: flagellar biosynthesis anti-sigma factor FlgM [Bordetella]|uniref:Negative regulator of flagellin synthesis n=1 Tax=Bordetella genomosp. 6 TaxID=463024 RepID=A0ABX4FM37_9BORD|nr:MULTISPECIES: flagellar biosynthesis anti-sigma factor FlgM [Bordetella]AOB27063.1 flagellar biosynthesis anti-sigma factor FlgM [Bordetella bronchiseptica]AZW44375.1 flagellar biosynthesis anti-sigma factor FlgM [Bordetella bronchiseptica]KCV66803.1 flagellar biosynthesis anti-sigma factor FlgM [Bordetella bronchiseptica 99-R-0433]OZI82257.1 flagellar biosynthesis anti-sigma factor FlgM [Bordetella genomosp. 6]